MSCVIGYNHKGVVYIGGDGTSASADNDVRDRIDPKVFILDKRFVIGFVGSFRMGQLLRFSFDPPKQKPTQDDFQYMCTSFINATIRCFEKGQFGGEKKLEGKFGGNFLVGYNRTLYNVDNDFQVSIPSLPFDSIGRGGDYALGALYAMLGLDLPIKQRIEKALEAATLFCAVVRPPFTILHI